MTLTQLRGSSEWLNLVNRYLCSVILVDTVCVIGYSTADATLYTALQSQADSKNIFLEIASTVKQAEGLDYIECLVAEGK